MPKDGANDAHPSAVHISKVELRPAHGNSFKRISPGFGVSIVVLSQKLDDDRRQTSALQLKVSDALFEVGETV